MEGKAGLDCISYGIYDGITSHVFKHGVVMED
jgi:hypothetical protein